jgi:hypothetical protein
MKATIRRHFGEGHPEESFADWCRRAGLVEAVSAR